MNVATAAKVLAVIAEDQPDADLDVGDSRMDAFWVQVRCPRPLSETTAAKVVALGAKQGQPFLYHYPNEWGQTWNLW